MYSDIENDYMSETYNDDITNEDETLSALKKLSNKNDIKAIRRYIIINKNKLKEYKTRLLNDVISVKGYKFLRRDGKLIIVKISPSSPYYNASDYNKEEPRNAFDNINSINNSKKRFIDGYNTRDYEHIASDAEFEGFNLVSEATEADSETSLNMNPIKRYPNDEHEIKNVYKPTETHETIKEPTKHDLLTASYSIKTTPENLNSLEHANQSPVNADSEHVKLGPVAQNANPLMKTINGFDTDNLTSILNSIYKQASEQNNSQRLQYEQLTKTLNDSIEAKNTAEQERVNKFNKCVDVIEKTFSAGTFDRIIEYINNMITSFNSIHENKYSQIDDKLNDVDNDLNNAYTTIQGHYQHR